MEAGKITIKSFLLSIAVLFFIEAGASALVSMGLFSPVLILGASRVFEAALIITIVVIWGGGLYSIGLARYQIFPGIRKGLLWTIAFGAIVAVGAGILYITGVNPLNLIQTRLPDQLLELLGFFFVGGLLAPVAEEVFFRGILYGFFRRWGVVAAVSLSTLIFVLGHYTDTTFPVTQAVGGVVFAAAYEVEGKLMVPITIHVLGNMAIFTISVLF